MGKKNIDNVMYRLIVILDNDEAPEMKKIWQGNNFPNSELDEKYRLWINKKDSKKILNPGERVNGSILEKASYVTHVHVQVGCYDKKKKNYKWDDRDYMDSLDKLKISMR